MNFKYSLEKKKWLQHTLYHNILNTDSYFFFMIGRERGKRGEREKKKWLQHTFYHNILNTNSYFLFFFWEIERKGEEREREGRKERREKGEERDEERGEKREEREERDSKLLREKQSQQISCLHERLFLVKISLENPTNSIKIQFIKQSFEIWMILNTMRLFLSDEKSWLNTSRFF